MQPDNAITSPALVGGPFELIDHHGRLVTDRSFRGRKLLMLFGFTHCRVVCPRSLRDVSSALDVIGAPAEELTALYITVDPERDDPSAMRAFLSAYPRFIGLTGTRDQVDRVKSAYRIYARRRADAAVDGDYVIAHTSLAFVSDESGACVSHFPLVADDSTLVDRLRTILALPTVV